jgi:hypothetical protein
MSLVARLKSAGMTMAMLRSLNRRQNHRGPSASKGVAFIFGYAKIAGGSLQREASATSEIAVQAALTIACTS